MNPFHGVPLSLWLLPAFAVILITMARGKNKRLEQDQESRRPGMPNQRHPHLQLRKGAIPAPDERSWFHGRDDDKAA
jgi:hypothetical protein